jgi:predicted enzyme related to lactoylglutathione lyase
MSKRAIVHLEIPAGDTAEAAAFYSDLFGWDTQRDEAMEYTMFESGSVAGGFAPLGEQVKPGDILVYIESEDIEADLKRIEAKGGKTLMPKQEIPNMGWFVFFADPAGNRMGLFQSMGEQ